MNKMKNKLMANKVLVYDDNCPLCKAYSGWFVKWGLLSNTGRIGYSQINERIANKIDHERYKREIALIDLGEETTLYGVDSLFYIFCSNFPVLKLILNSSPIYRFATELYPFISYNRKIIAPHKKIECTRDCTPPFHFRYRLAFIGVAFIIALILTVLLGIAINKTVLHTSNVKAVLIAVLASGIGWSLQGVCAMFLKPYSRITYYGHLATLMIIGTVLLLPIILSYFLFGYAPGWMILVNIPLSFFLMLKQHYDRVKIMKLPTFWTVLWSFNLLISLSVTLYLLGVL